MTSARVLETPSPYQPMTTSAATIWTTVLGQLQLQVPKPSYETWLKGTVGMVLDSGCLTVAVPSTFAAEWLERRMQTLVQNVLLGVAGHPVQVQFKVSSPSPLPTTGPVQGVNGLSSVERLPQAVQDRVRQKPTNGFNHRYTFDSFVTGGSNRLAYAAAKAVAERPGLQYNPLFIYSGVGLGKTHLLHAIAMHVASQGLVPLYVTTEQFTNDFILAIRERTTEDFRTKYRTPDVLLLDDIQFLTGKEQTQEGLFHTFNDLHNANRQIVVASDRAPSAVALLEDRLRSRFEWGLLADIQPPDLETRVAILQEKARSQGLTLGNDVALLLAQRHSNSVRELEGNLNRVTALASFLGDPITPELVKMALPDFAPALPVSLCSPDAALAGVAEFYSIPREKLVARSRDRKTSHPQRMAMYILVEKLHESPSKVAAYMGKWHARTIINALKAISDLLVHEPPFQLEVEAICKRLDLISQ